MRRRHFLEAAGVAPLVFGGAQQEALAEERPKAQRPAQRDGPLAVLITSAETPLARAVADRLAKQYRVRLTSRGEPVVGGRFEHVPNRLDHDGGTRSLVRGMDATVLVAETPAREVGASPIDERARCTYNLLRAAAEEGVRAAVYLSSLEMMADYDGRFSIDEDFRPLAGLRGDTLADYLGEFTCREFAREEKLAVVVLRLGRMRRTEQGGDPSPDPLALDPRDAVEAVALALDAVLAKPSRLGLWSVFHILSAVPGSHFSWAKAQRVLGYRPQFNG